jgi:RND family efflux transporter MFP subunit
MEPSKPQTSSLLDNKDNQETVSKPARARRRPWRWLLLALLLVGGGIVVWRLLTPASEAPPANAEQPQGTRVRLSPVKTATLRESSEFVANLDSRRSVTLQPRIEGQISKIFVSSGAQVAAGTPIIQVDPDEQQAAVSSVSAAAQAARAEVENARATLRSLEAQRLSNLSDVQYNQKEYQRYSRLADQGAVARSIGDQYTNRIQTAQASLSATNKQIEAQRATIVQQERALQEAQANIREQQAQLQYFRISAPFAGTVGQIPVKVGDFVNTSTQLTTVTQNQPLEVEISVPIERAPEVRPGTTVELLNGEGKSVGTSRVFFIAPNTANTTQSVLIKSLFENSQNQLRADQYVRARVIWNQRPGVLVPTTAVTRLGGETFVYVAQQEQSQQKQSQEGQAQQEQPQLVARQKTVKLGAIQGNNYQVLEGLKPGERLIVSGILNLKDGAPITPES